MHALEKAKNRDRADLRLFFNLTEFTTFESNYISN